MKSYHIHFLRHGSTKANYTGQYVGSTDIPLLDSGKKDLENLSNKYSYPKTNVIYTSPLKRCLQTCEILYPELEYIKLPEFAECNFGNWENKTAEDLKNDKDFTNWLSDSGKYSPPGGESSIKFAHRVCSAFENLVETLMRTGTTNVCIVTHSGVITTLLSAYGLPKASPINWAMCPGCGYSVRIIPSLWMRNMIMEVYEQLPICINNL